MHVTHQYSTYGGNDERVKILDVTPYGKDLCSGLTREDRLQSRGKQVIKHRVRTGECLTRYLSSHRAS
jgi:hypothetical protein